MDVSHWHYIHPSGSFSIVVSVLDAHVSALACVLMFLYVLNISNGQEKYEKEARNTYKIYNIGK